MAAQVGVLFLTFVMGSILGAFAAQDPWFVALAQAAAGIGFVYLLAARGKGRAVLAVPLASFALTLGLMAVSNTVGVACSDRVLSDFRQLPPPPGVKVETFVSPSQGCMAETTPARIPQSEVFDHYRNELRSHGWPIVSDDSEGLRAERDDVYVFMYLAEGRVYFILGRCGEWGTRCLSQRGQG